MPWKKQRNMAAKTPKLNHFTTFARTSYLIAGGDHGTSGNGLNRKFIVFITIGLVTIFLTTLQLSKPRIGFHIMRQDVPETKLSADELLRQQQVWASFVGNATKELDVHLHDPALGHTGEVLHDDSHAAVAPSSGDNAMLKVALGGAITSRGNNDVTAANMEEKFIEFTILLPSFCRTVSTGYSYHFYHAFDIDDPVFIQPALLSAFHDCFERTINRLCPASLPVSLHLLQCNHTHNPAWAQNDAMMEAYLDGADYFYRLNDDSQILTPGWVEAFISTLKAYDPPNVGVVGPHFDSGNTGILTHDFVHRSHVDLFGCYYPRVFTDWWADDWITVVYQPGRSTKLKHMQLKHTQKLGQRYSVKVNRRDSGDLQRQLDSDKPLLLRYIDYRHGKIKDPFPEVRKVIAMSLYGRDPLFTLGAIRNAQLLPVIYPGWTLRIYIANQNASSPPEQPRYYIPQRILNFLESYPNVTVVRVPDPMLTVDPMMWRHLVIDDPDVDYFLIRDADERISDREAGVVYEWILLQQAAPSTGAFVHCIRDHPKHTAVSLVGGLWGGRNNLVRTAVTTSSIADLLHTIAISKVSLSRDNSLPVQREPDLFRDVIWSALKNHTYCHDSVACDQWPDSHPMPARVNPSEYVGQRYDSTNYPLNNDHESLQKTDSKCTLKDS